MVADLGQIRQHGLALSMYADDNDGCYLYRPTGLSSWSFQLANETDDFDVRDAYTPYIPPGDVYGCELAPDSWKDHWPRESSGKEFYELYFYQMWPGFSKSGGAILQAPFNSTWADELSVHQNKYPATRPLMGELVRFKSGLYNSTHVDGSLSAVASDVTSNYIMADMSGRAGIRASQMSHLWTKNDGTKILWYVEE